MPRKVTDHMGRLTVAVAPLPGGPDGFTIEHLEGGYQLDAAVLIRDAAGTVVLVGAEHMVGRWQLVDVTETVWRSLHVSLAPAELYAAAADAAHAIASHADLEA